MKFYQYILIVIFTNLFSLSLIQAQDTLINHRPKIGLILSGGGAKGLAHIGVLKVLEEAGIRPDYIGGTSMGSIVGALYAIGYDADSLEKIVKSTDWDYYLGDEISRRNLTIEEKEDNDRFFIFFPVKDNKIKIPSGVVNGQNIENLFNRLCAPVYDKRDFSEFQIPFLCVATDIETGDEVVFKQGYLPQVIRASMSIPSIFNPIELNGKLLVDGGVVNNFPVAQVKDMGMDILIGVDVGFQYYKKEELNSIFRIIEQSVFFYGEELNEYNESLCDILIEPSLEEFNASSFNSADTIIARGELIARKYFDQFKSIADSLKTYDQNYGPDQNLPGIDSLQIMEIRINGLEKVSGSLVTGKLQMNVFDKVTPGDIETAIDRLYSSLYFDKITYELEDLSIGTRLIVNVVERKGGQFRVGMHYDSNYKAAIILNTTFRNLLLDGSKLSLSLALGENPFFKASFFKNNGWKPGYGINFESNEFDVFVYDEGRKISSLSYSESKTQIFTQSIFWNSYTIGGGVEFEANRIKPKIDPALGAETSTSSYLNYYGFLRLDTYDNISFPKKGMRLNSQLKIITNKDILPMAFLATRFSQAINLSDRLTYINNLYGGAVDGDSIPYQYNFFLGGQNPIMRNGVVPFVGLDFLEKEGRNVLAIQGNLQYELLNNFYITLKGSAGNLKNNFNQLLNTDNIYSGYGLSLGYDSFIGPIEVSVMKSSNRAGILGFVNVGFWF